MARSIESTMQDFPITISHILRHGRDVFPDAQVVTFDGEGVRRASFQEVARRAARLAGALRRLGVEPGDRVGTFCWNHQEHLEAYLSVPCMGAVLHTLNIRLFADQLTYVINHGEDRVLIVDGSLVPVLAKVAPGLDAVRDIIVVGEGDASILGDVLRYEDLLGAERDDFAWPDLDERVAAAMCYTTGTTGEPKGVVYSHRSVFLHALNECSGSFFGLSPRDSTLFIAPMFHANSWGLPYAAWMSGGDLVFPGRFLQAEPLTRLIALTRPTVSGAVPTVWTDILRFSETHPVDLSSLRLVICGGSAVPSSLIEAFRDRHGVPIVQAYGLTETSPAVAVSFPPPGTPPDQEMVWRSKTGRILHGVETRVCDASGAEVARDGAAIGEIELRGPWVTARYHGVDAPERFHDGWLRTGDVGTVDRLGYLQITDRAKDVIKTGGEWISSVELENALMGHPDVLEAAVVGVIDDRWGERPMACVVLRPEAAVTPAGLRTFLVDRVARWWLPERWAMVSAIPKTSVGKFDKKALRAAYAEGALHVVLEPAPAP